jgi:hypothetical protein
MHLYFKNPKGMISTIITMATGFFKKSKKPASGNEPDTVRERQVNEEERESPDYRVAWLSILGVAGFIFGCIIIFYPDFSDFKLSMLNPFSQSMGPSVFHEIEYEPRKIARGAIEKSIQGLNDSITNKLEIFTSYKDSVDSAKKYNLTEKLKIIFEKKKEKLSKRIDDDSNTIKDLTKYRAYYEDSSITDTFAFKNVNKALHFKITPDLIYKWESNFKLKKYDWRDTVRYFFKVEKNLFSVSDTTGFSIHHYKSDIQFISRYPASGIWLLLVLIFCSFSFMAISNCIYLNNRIISDHNQITIASRTQYFFITGITFLVLCALVIIWSLTFYDEEPIKNIYFLRTLGTSLAMIAVLGYAAGAFCLSGFIYNAAMLTSVSNDVKVSKEKILDKEQAPGYDKDNATLQQEIKMLKTGIASKKIAVDNLLKYFNNYFILSAIILSLMVLCTGALYSTVSSLDFIKLLEDDWGYSPVRTDFVYLYAGLHTVILLLIYVPAKIRFNEIKTLFDGIELDDKNAERNTANGTDKETKGKWYDFLKDSFNAMKGTLLAVSPLLASLTQSLLDMLFK